MLNLKRLKQRICNAIVATQGLHLDVKYHECGDVRVTTLFKDGKHHENVVLYTLPREDGLYEVGMTYHEYFDRAAKSIVLEQALLDRIPENGETIEDWIPYRSKNDAMRGMATAYRFLVDNHLDGIVLSERNDEYAD